MREPVADTRFTGLRALVVEDETLVAMLLEDILVEHFGCVVVAQAMRLSEGLAAAQSNDIDVAFLDLNLDGESSLPIAQILSARGVPIMLTSGYDEAGYPDPAVRFTAVGKPYTAAQIGAALAGASLGAPQA